MGRTDIKAGTEEWLEWRRTRITATDWAPLLLNDAQRPPWMATPLGIWERVTGRQPPEDPGAKPWLEWGLWAEHMAAPWYEHLTGRRVTRTDVLWVAEDGPGAGDWMGCTLDGLVFDGDLEGVWECKAPGFRGSEAWESGEGGYVVPLHYQIQIQAQLACTGRAWGAVSCVTWPNHFYGDVQRRHEWIKPAWEKLDSWWRTHVVGDTPPPPCASDADARILARMHDPRENEVTMPADLERMCEDLEVIEADLKAKDVRSKKLRNDLREWMQRNGARRVVNPARTIAWQFAPKSGLRRVKP